MPVKYRVVKRASDWWVTMDGTDIGKHGSILAAERSAIILAQMDFQESRMASVTVQNEDEFHTVYDSSNGREGSD